MMLKRVLQTGGRQWDKLLPYVLFTYRDMPHESTGYSPFKLVYGCDVRGPLDLLKEAYILREKEPNDIATYVMQARK